MLLALSLGAACRPEPAGPLPPRFTAAAVSSAAGGLPTRPATWTAAPPATRRPTGTRPPPAPATPSLTAPPTRTFTPTPTATTTPLPGNRSTIGASVAGRPLEVYQFGAGPVERLIVADIHGGYEANTAALADQLILYLNDHPETVPADVTLYILRSLNPDGLARARGVDGQMNEHGVDLNRNWPSNWHADWPRSGCWTFRPVTAGAAPLSEPETQALAGFILAHPLDALISYHSAALGIFAGGYADDRLSLRLAEAVAGVSDYPYPPVDTGCMYTGELADWASEQGLAALDIELTNHRDADFDQNLRILGVFLSWRP